MTHAREIAKQNEKSRLDWIVWALTNQNLHPYYSINLCRIHAKLHGPIWPNAFTYEKQRSKNSSGRNKLHTPRKSPTQKAPQSTRDMILQNALSPMQKILQGECECTSSSNCNKNVFVACKLIWVKFLCAAGLAPTYYWQAKFIVISIWVDHCFVWQVTGPRDYRTLYGD